MANSKIIERKAGIVSEIKEKFENAKSVVLFDYRGLTDEEAKELRRSLRNSGGDYKVYKNTLMSRALRDLNIDIDESLFGPSALAYSEDQVAPIKVLTDFAKKHPAVVLKVGIVDKEITDKAKLAELATIPSRDGLLTMLAGSLIGVVKDLSICLDLYSKEKEEN